MPDREDLYEYCLVALFCAYTLLLSNSVLKLSTHGCIYGVQRGIVVLLACGYLLTLLINTLMVLFVLFNEIDKLSSLYENNEYATPTMVRIFSSYITLGLNFFLSCLIIACFIYLFSDLFAHSAYSLIKKYGINKTVLFLLITPGVYVVFIVITAVVTEFSDIDVLDLAILSYIHALPCVINIWISFHCLLQLPIAQPLDLSIGLYQRNTFCSCYTAVTRYVWSILIIACAQIMCLVIYIMDIDVWNFKDDDNKKLFGVFNNNESKIVFFISQFIALIWMWDFLKTSLKQNRELTTVLDVLKGKYITPQKSIIDEANADNAEIGKIRVSNDSTDVSRLTSHNNNNNKELQVNDQNDEQPLKTVNESTEFETFRTKNDDDDGDDDSGDSSVHTEINYDDDDGDQPAFEANDTMRVNHDERVEMAEIARNENDNNESVYPPKPDNDPDEVSSNVTRIRDDDAKMSELYSSDAVVANVNNNMGELNENENEYYDDSNDDDGGNENNKNTDGGDNEEMVEKEEVPHHRIMGTTVEHDSSDDESEQGDGGVDGLMDDGSGSGSGTERRYSSGDSSDDDDNDKSDTPSNRIVKF